MKITFDLQMLAKKASSISRGIKVILRTIKTQENNDEKGKT